MAAKPTKTPRWGTLANRTVEPPENGTLTTSKDQGFIVATKPPARFVNWLFNNIYTWILWLQDINNQPFTAAGVGAWSRGQEFTPTTANETAAVFTGNGSAAGITSIGGSSNGTGVMAIGQGNGFGISCTAVGIFPAGFFENDGPGAGVSGQAGPDGNAPGGEFTGGGTGDAIGVQGTGGAGGNGIGCQGLGSGTGPGCKGTGGQGGGVGGSFTGTGNLAGVSGSGSGFGPGVTGTGGSNTGYGGYFTGGTNGNGVLGAGTGAGSGVIGTGGITGYGGSFAGGSTSGNAINCGRGDLLFSGPQLAPSDDPGVNRGSALSQCKAGGCYFIVDGSDTDATRLKDGYNVASVATAGEVVTVTFRRAMANVYYRVDLTGTFDPFPPIGSGSARRAWSARVTSKTLTAFQVTLTSIQFSTGSIDPQNWDVSMGFDFDVFGRQ